MFRQVRDLFRKNETALVPVRPVPVQEVDSGIDSHFLVKAAHTGEENFVQYLLEQRKVDIDTTDERGNTALYWAAHDGKMKIVQILLRHGATVDAPNHEGNTPMLIAAHQGRRDIVELLANQGADVNHANREGNSPLILAMLKGHKDTVQYLVDMDADIQHVNKKGVSALIIAEGIVTRGGSKEIAEIVLRANGSVRPMTAVPLNAALHAAL